MREHGEKLTWTREVPVAAEYDVLVAGGGPSGIAAAAAAARLGARTGLIERYGFPGGMATAGYVAPVSEYMLNGTQVIFGIPWELAERMRKHGGAMLEAPRGNLSFSPESFKLEAQRMLLEAGAELRLHSTLSGVRTDGEKRVTHVFIETKGGPQALAARYVIDCTGDADAAAMAGVPMQPAGEKLQPATLCFMLGNVDTGAVNTHMARPGSSNAEIRNALNALAEEYPVPKFGGPWHTWMMADGHVIVNTTRARADMTDPAQQTRAECALREDVHTLVKLWKEHFPPFRDAVLLATAAQAGVRETRHILGAHVLTGEELLRAEHFADAVSRAAHPVDIHDPASNAHYCRYLDQAGYVPYRSIYAPGFPNLLVPCRAFSADGVAFASVRVMASMMALGEAAGAAAALCARDGRSVAEADTDAVRAVLTGWGEQL